MELVPIVITALEIVLALAIITFIVSYISYKIRSKVSPEQFEPQQDMKPKFATRRLDRLTYVTKEIMHISKPKAAPQKPEQPSEKQRPVEVRNLKANLHPAENRQKLKRIEIVKNINGTGNKENEDLREKPENNGSLRSLDDGIFNKYVDDENHPLFSLKTNKNDSKE